MYAADALTSQGSVPVSVDILDRLPCPFGLVRYGVAPDHLSIRSVRQTLEKFFDRPGVRFLGNVEVGRDITVAELHRYYDAIVFTYGAARDRRLGIEGEELAGSIAATALVAWYCGHPDAPRELIESSLQGASSVVIVGVGNVAVDVTRVLAKTRAELEHTDMPEHVLALLDASNITDIHLLGRRGPVQATFTTKELRELGELDDAEVIVDSADLVLDPFSEAALAQDRVAARNLDVLREWSTRTPRGSRRRVHVRFLTRPVELLGTALVEKVVVERTRLDETGAAIGTGELETIGADLVVRSVGYRGEPLAELPFDSRRGVVPNDAGRVLRDDAVVPGEYVAGWIKRGPTGIIGTNKKDAAQTVNSLLEDAERLPLAVEPAHDAVTTMLCARGIEVVTFDGWERIDAAEIALGVSAGRVRTTMHERDALLGVALGERHSPRPDAGDPPIR